MRKQVFVAWLVVTMCLVTALPAIAAASASALSFAPPEDYGLGGRSADLACADMNGDGRPDIVVSAGAGLDVLLCADLDRFAPARRILLEHRPGAVAAADFDRDGRPDLATTDVESKSVSVRMNGQLPVLIGVSPARGRIGDVVTPTGRHFGMRGTVQFGGRTAGASVSWSASKIRVRVPRGTARGAVKVTVTTLIGRSAGKAFLRL